MARSKSGESGRQTILYGVGLGPGDPGLITVRAKEVLEESSVVFVPVTRKAGGGRALSILASLEPELAKKAVQVHIPMDRSAEKWKEVAMTVIEGMPAGSSCSFATEGDPLLYGSFGHLLKALREEKPDLKVEVISGVPSFCAAAASCGFALASGKEKVVIAPGTLNAEEMEELLEGDAVVVLLKLGLCLEEFRRFLTRNRERVEWWCVEDCSLPEERSSNDLQSLHERKWGYFTLAIFKRKTASKPLGRESMSVRPAASMNA